MSEIVHIAAECFPFAKVGGLADVVGALPKYQNKLGLKAKVIMPFYANAFTLSTNLKKIHDGSVHLGEKEFEVEVFQYDKKNEGFPVVLIKIAGLTDRENVYGYIDDTERFFAFQLAALQYLQTQKKLPSIIHCHDHHTGLIPFFCTQVFQFDAFTNIPTVVTIHNAQYQGEFGYDKHLYFPDYNQHNTGLLDWYGKINPLASAIKCAWKVTTVSPAYMEELKVRPSGLEDLLLQEADKCVGILNGIDHKHWNPQIDPHLIANYTNETAKKGRQKNKVKVCKDFQINPDLPMIAFIGRFVYEKGSDLLAQVIQKALGDLDLQVSILILGSGDSHTEYELNSIKETFKGRYDNYIGYNEKLSHQIYASADFLLMPSRVEPCGLNQMYAMRYGTLPVTSNNGGLSDTVFDYEYHKNGLGIVFNEVSVNAITNAIVRAANLFEDKTKFKGIQQQLMQVDHSWDKSAKEYKNMYTKLIAKTITYD